MGDAFALDPVIAAASHPIVRLPLCEVRLQDDARWPWLVLVPRLAGLTEMEALTAADRARLMEETVAAGRAVRALGAATGFAVMKLNLGALGNVVPQLHLHVVGRRPADAAWPGPVWGVGSAESYDEVRREVAIAAARAVLAAGGRAADAG